MVGEIHIDLRAGTIVGNFTPGPDAPYALIEAMKEVMAHLVFVSDGDAYITYDEGKVFNG